MNHLTAVVTTIQRPTQALQQLASRLVQHGARMVVAGDKKGPDQFELPSCEFLDLAGQKSSGFKLALALPEGHYARKNIAYLRAMTTGATCIYETDDDNAPNSQWAPRELQVQARSALAKGWVNVYRCFSSQLIWPRGLPLDEVIRLGAEAPSLESLERAVQAPIQQGLANNSPTWMRCGVWCWIHLSSLNLAPAFTCPRAPGAPSTAKAPGGGPRPFHCCICPATVPFA